MEARFCAPTLFCCLVVVVVVMGPGPERRIDRFVVVAAVVAVELGRPKRPMAGEDQGPEQGSKATLTAPHRNRQF
jgi:hypothetical protein